jgi:hypothetical protein
MKAVSLRNFAQPVNRQELVRDLNAHGAGIPQRIKQSITQNLRAGNLAASKTGSTGAGAWQGYIR